VLLDRVQQRRANYTFYKEAFAELPAIQFPDEPSADFYSNRWLSTVLIDDTKGVSREDIRLALEEENIESRPLWKPMHLQPVFAGTPFYGDGTSERLFEKGLCLPSGSNMTDEERERVAVRIKACFKAVTA
jgi:dTDP-4-amino-4,6-dideoxygalactose transaminase